MSLLSFKSFFATRAIFKIGEYSRIFHSFSWGNIQSRDALRPIARERKDLMDYKDNSLHLGRKYARIFVLGHYLFLVAHSFPRALLSENCSLLGTDNREFTKPRRQRHRERHQTKGLMSSTMAVHVRFESLYICRPLQINDVK